MNRGTVALLLGLLLLPAVAISETAPGPDLGGEFVAIPGVGTAGQAISLSLRLFNQGTEAAGPFSYRILAEPDPLPPGTLPALTEELLLRRLEGGIDPGEEIELHFDGDSLPRIVLPNLLRGDLYRFVLVVDVNDEVQDVDRTNNRVYSAGKMATLKPALQLTRAKVDFSFPHGSCVLGEAVEASLEICNMGTAPAVNFQPGVILGEGDFISFLIDPVSATAPPACGAPLSPNYLACSGTGDSELVCAGETCRQSCTSNGDCVPPLRCLPDRFLDGERSCMASIEPGSPCQTFHVSGRIPAFDRLGVPHSAGEFRLHFSADTRRVLSETSPQVVTSGPFHCSEPLPDLAVVAIEIGETGVAGEPLAIHRHLRNLGFLPPGQDGLELEYRYYLSVAGSADSPLAIPLALQGTSGAGIVTIGRSGDNFLTDHVELPPQLPAGDYLLTLVLDPEDRIPEASKANNRVTVAEPIRVAASPFRIVSRALPAAAEGGLYLHQFAAVGGDGALRWTARGLPAGLLLEADGLLRGVPRAAGTYSFEVRVSAGDRSTSATVALQVEAPRGSLGVATQVLPAAIRGRSYGGFVDAEGEERAGVPLAAVGGIPPYAWELAPRSSADRLPQGLVLLAPEGILRGEPSPLSRTSSFVVRVRDAAGAEAIASLELQVVAAGDLIISSRLFDDGLGGQPYSSCVDASGGDRESGYRWEIDPDSTPAGLVFEEREGQACLHGTPTVCGNYLIEARVSDGAGQSFQARLPLSIECDVIRISTNFPDAFARGETVDLELGSNAGPGAIFRRLQGDLPPGLELLEEGRIVGTVAASADFGAYDLLVEVRDTSGRRGLNALTIRIRPEAREPIREERERTGCAAAASGSGLLAALVSIGGLRFLGRRRLLASAPRRLPPGLMGLFLVGLLGCETTTEVVEKPLCEGVVCADPLSCDPVDGLCKCDGALCTGRQVCLPEPSPHCGDLSCEFVHCDRGQSCDPETVTCSCRGEVCDEDEVCTDAGCSRPSKCDGVQCSGALRCDPADGQCKCGDAICTQHESCLEGSCVEDLCVGVHCVGAEVCDPADGLCHCGGAGGPICQASEACIRESGAEDDEEGIFVCSFTALCDHDSCEGGTTCDPADGSCRCGGAGRLAPACSPEQVCVEGSCRGGDLCASVVCEPGFSCDDTDGRCKCGGSGGDRCEAGEVCVADVAGAFACAEGCTLEPSGESTCPAGQGCYLDRALGHGVAFCAPAGPLQVDDPCEAFNDCGPGLFCSAAGFCRRVCHPSEPVDIACRRTPGAFCLPFGEGESRQPDLGYCIVNPG